MSGEIFSIVFTPEGVERRPEARYARESLSAARLLAGYGIEGDAKGGKNPDRHLNIMSYEMLQALGGEGFTVEPGAMGEQMIVSGLDVDALAPGTRLRLGESAVVQITKPRTGCNRFEAIQGKPRTAAAKRMGQMARVVETGDVRVGDAVTVVQAVIQ